MPKISIFLALATVLTVLLPKCEPALTQQSPESSAKDDFVTYQKRQSQIEKYQRLLGANATNYEWESVLLQYLFVDGNYNPEARPAVISSLPVTVRLDMVLLKINELVEKDQEIVISGFLKINWTDERLSWKQEDFGGIEWMVTKATNVWLPDIALINSNDVYAVTRDNRFPVTITHDGHVLFVPAGKIHARCELDLRFFPFDYQVCYYRFESWVYAAESVSINGYNFTIDPNHYATNHQWDILDSFVLSRQVTYEDYNFSRVDFYMFLKRKSLFFITYTIFPCLALSTLQIFSHMLPFTESERINFATTTLIAFSVFHVAIVEQMPQSSESVPLLAIYVDSLMILIGLSLIECFIMMNWLSKVAYTVPSPVAWYLVVEHWGDYMFLGSAGELWRRNYIKIYLRLMLRYDFVECKRRRKRILEKNGINFSSTSPCQNTDELISVGEQIANLGEKRRKPNKAERVILRKMAKRWNVEGPIRFDGLGGENVLKNSRTLPEQQQYSDIKLIDEQSPSPQETAKEFNKALNDRSPYNTAGKPPLPGRPASGGNVGTVKQWDIDCYKMSFRQKKRSDNNPAEYLNVDCDSPTTQYDNMTAPLSRLNFAANRQPRYSGNDADEFESLPSECGSECHMHHKHSHRHHHHRHHHHHHHRHHHDKHRDRESRHSKCDDCTNDEVLMDPPDLAKIISAKDRHFRHSQDSCLSSSASHDGKASRPRRLLVEETIEATLGRRQKSKKTPKTPSSEDIEKALIQIHEYVGDISAAVQSHELKRECIGVWTTFITVIDRIMSVLLMLLFGGMAMYLFLIFPETPDIQATKADILDL